MEKKPSLTKKSAIVLFSKAPIPGLTKTRLSPYLNHKESAELCRCFLKRKLFSKGRGFIPAAR